MAWIIAAVIGAIIGLLYGSGINSDRRLYSLINLLIGAAGGVIGVWFFFGVLGLVSASAGVNVALMVLWAIIGAVILMAIVDAINFAVYRSRVRRTVGRRTREQRGYAREYDARDYDVVEEEHKIKRKQKK